jgi:hypothetical protein
MVRGILALLSALTVPAATQCSTVSVRRSDPLSWWCGTYMYMLALNVCCGVLLHDLWHRSTPAHYNYSYCMSACGIEWLTVACILGPVLANRLHPRVCRGRTACGLLVLHAGPAMLLAVATHGTVVCQHKGVCFFCLLAVQGLSVMGRHGKVVWPIQGRASMPAADMAVTHGRPLPARVWSVLFCSLPGLGWS